MNVDVGMNKSRSDHHPTKTLRSLERFQFRKEEIPKKYDEAKRRKYGISSTFSGCVGCDTLLYHRNSFVDLIITPTTTLQESALFRCIITTAILVSQIINNPIPTSIGTTATQSFITVVVIQLPSRFNVYYQPSPSSSSSVSGRQLEIESFDHVRSYHLTAAIASQLCSSPQHE
jgi:hypothetical protein